MIRLRLKNSCSVLSLVALGILFVVSPARALSLSESIQKAWQHHPSLKAAKAGTLFAESDAGEQFSDYFPSFNVSGLGGRQYADNSTSRGLSVTRGAAYSYLWEANVALRQSVYDGGSRKSRYGAAKARKEASFANEDDARDILASAVSVAYIDLLYSYQNIALISAHKAVVADYIGRIESAVTQGAMDEAEYNQALDLALSIESLAIDYDTQLNNARVNYQELVGALPAGELSSPLLPEGTVPINSAAAFEVAKDNHPALQRLKMELQSTILEIDTERAAYYPTVDGELSYLKSEKDDVIGGETIDARAVMRMNWSFDTGGATIHRVDKAKSQQEQSRAQLKEFEKTIQKNVQLSYASYEGAMQNMNTQWQRLILNRKLFQTYKEQFEGARVSVFQLMQIDNQKFLTELDYIASQNNVLSAQYTILSAMGRAKDLVTLSNNQGTQP